MSHISRYDYSSILVIKNTEKTLRIYDSNAAERADGNNLSYIWIMEIEQGDTVYLYSVNYLYADSDYHLTFTGQLIQMQ